MDSSLTNDGMGGRVLLATERAFFSTNLLMSCHVAVREMGRGWFQLVVQFCDLVDRSKKLPKPAGDAPRIDDRTPILRLLFIVRHGSNETLQQ